MNFRSHHPEHVRRGVIKSLLNRARRVVTGEENLKKEYSHLNKVFKNNGYPYDFISRSSKSSHHLAVSSFLQRKRQKLCSTSHLSGTLQNLDSMYWQEQRFTYITRACVGILTTIHYACIFESTNKITCTAYSYSTMVHSVSNTTTS